MCALPPFLMLSQAALIVAKLAGWCAWRWGWVLCGLWLPAVVVLAGLLGAFVASEAVRANEDDFFSEE